MFLIQNIVTENEYGFFDSTAFHTDAFFCFNPRFCSVIVMPSSIVSRNAVFFSGSWLCAAEKKSNAYSCVSCCFRFCIRAATCTDFPAGIVMVALANTVVLQPLIDTFIHKTLIHPQYLDFFMSSLMHFFVVLYCVSRETMV